MSRLGNTKDLCRIRDVIEKQYGLAFPDRQLSVLAGKLEPVLSSLGVGSLSEALDVLTKPGAAPLPELAQALTIGETYFFRNRAQFDALKTVILPGLATSLPWNQPLVIWSAGCATGEEPYSLAMWIREHAAHLWPHRVRIVATDINRDFLARAREGRFREWSLRQVEDYWRRRYFSVDGQHLVIDGNLREAIAFREHNLVSGMLPRGLAQGDVHLVFCRNVLIYFMPSTSVKVLELFRRALKPDGVLMLGHAESFATLKEWQLTYHQGTFSYKPPSASRGLAATPKPAIDCAAAARRAARRPSSKTTRSADQPLERKTSPSTTVPTREPDVDTLAEARRAADACEFETARRLLAEHTSKNKTSTEAYFLSAVVAEQLGDWETARTALKKALFLEKNLVLGHYFLAVLAERRADLAEALRRYRTVCRLLRPERDDVELPYGDGLTAGRLRELSEARALELGSQGVQQQPRGA